MAHLVELKVSVQSSLVASELLRRIGNYCETNAPAWIFGTTAATGAFPVIPRKVRKPDARWSSTTACRPSSSRGLPHASARRGDRGGIAPRPAYEVAEKVEEYLGAECPWSGGIPDDAADYIHRVDGSIAVVRSEDELSGEDLLPGFRCKVEAIFAVLPAAAKGS